MHVHSVCRRIERCENMMVLLAVSTLTNGIPSIVC